MTSIVSIKALPGSPFDGSGFVGIVITSGIPSYFRVIGTNLENIKSVDWYPDNPSSVSFEVRNLLLVSPTEGTFMVKVLDNMLNTSDRGGRVSFRLSDGTTLTYPVKTYGPVSVGPLWIAPREGLITG